MEVLWGGVPDSQFSGPWWHIEWDGRSILVLLLCGEQVLTDTGSTTSASSSMKRGGRGEEVGGNEGGGGGVV